MSGGNASGSTDRSPYIKGSFDAKAQTIYHCPTSTSHSAQPTLHTQPPNPLTSIMKFTILITAAVFAAGCLVQASPDALPNATPSVQEPAAVPRWLRDKDASSQMRRQLRPYPMAKRSDAPVKKNVVPSLD